MQLHLKHVSKALGGKPVLQEVNLTLQEGQVACLLGSSGCGKTTLLRCVAGFESIDSGSIHLDDGAVAGNGCHVAPHARGVGMVFQDHALFPHLTVAQNAAFGLHHWNRREASKRVAEVLALVGLADYGERFPHQLSGGQQQRAALARALATKPRLLLLDEPFASLDRELRYRLVQEVGEILRNSSTTALWVTHDAREALQAADYVGVMRNGSIVQWDTPARLYARPVSPEVASAIGDCTMLPGVMLTDKTASTPVGDIAIDAEVALSPDQHVSVLIRPEQVVLYPANDAGSDNNRAVVSASPKHPDDNVMDAVVQHVWFHGLSTLCIVELDDGTQIKVVTTGSPDLRPGSRVRLALNTDKTIAFV